MLPLRRLLSRCGLQVGHFSPIDIQGYAHSLQTGFRGRVYLVFALERPEGTRLFQLIICILEVHNIVNGSPDQHGVIHTIYTVVVDDGALLDAVDVCVLV